MASEVTLTNVSASNLPGGSVIVGGTATLSSDYDFGGENLNLSAYINGSATPSISIPDIGVPAYLLSVDNGNSTA